MTGRDINMKVCTTCNIEKDLKFFSKSKKGLLGHKSECKECQSTYRKKHYKENKQKAYEYNKNRRLEFRDDVNAYKRQHKKKRASYYAALNAKRRAAQLQRTPAWLTKHDYKVMEAKYAMSLWLSEVVGQQYHVDHIIPLQGKNVSGLHVPDNLRIIPAKENMKKGNRVNG